MYVFIMTAKYYLINIMIMKTLSLILSLLFGTIFLPAAQAQYCNNDYDYYYYNNSNPHHHYRNHRTSYYYENNMSIRSFERRIENGINSGELTRRERRKLVRELNKLINYRDHILRDGYISRYERRKFEKKKIKLDRMIFEKKHNRHRRY